MAGVAQLVRARKFPWSLVPRKSYCQSTAGVVTPATHLSERSQAQEMLSGGADHPASCYEFLSVVNERDTSQDETLCDNMKLRFNSAMPFQVIPRHFFIG